MTQTTKRQNFITSLIQVEELVDINQKLPDEVKKLRGRLRKFQKSLFLPLKRPSDPKARETTREKSYWNSWKGEAVLEVNQLYFFGNRKQIGILFCF